MMNEANIEKLVNSLNELLEKANDSLKKIEELELEVNKYVKEELTSDSDKISEKFLKYSIKKIDQALLLYDIYNKGITVINKLIVSDGNISQEIRDFWNQVNIVIKNEIEEQELLGNYVLDYTKGKKLTEFEKEFIDKTFSGIAKIKNKE